MRKIVLFQLLMMSFLGAFSQETGQDDDLIGLLARMKHVKLFQASYPQEKVYVHFDNTAYFKGESIYFKAYVVRTDKSAPTDLSKVLYVDLLNPSGFVQHKCKLKIKHGEAHGEIPLDSLIGTGFFEVRAYTRYMLNFGDETAFSRVLPIFQKPENDGDYNQPVIEASAYFKQLPERDFADDTIATLDQIRKKRRKSAGYQVNLYPEGGKLVRGLLSRVAFTVLNKEHEPEELMGEVVDESGNTLAIVSSGADGRGVFDIIPGDTKLTLKLTTSDKMLEFDMPEVLSEGVVMRMDAVSSDAVSATLMSTDAMNGVLMGCSLMNNGNVYYTDTLIINGENGIRFRRDQLKPGVNQLTVFDSRGHIHAERLFFICPKSSRSDSILVDIPKDTLRPCGKVRLNLHTVPNTRFSFSAMDAAGLVNGKSGNINTYMLLGSDVRGFIPNPDYYFERDDEEHRMAVDMLMLVNGWRRYDWEVMADVSPWRGGRTQQIEDRLYVFGRLKPSLNRWKKKHNVAGVDMKLFIFNRKGQVVHGETRTDSTGFYAFRIPEIDSLWNMQIITTKKNKLKTFEVMIDRQFEPEARYISSAEADQNGGLPLFLNFKTDLDAFLKIDKQRATMQHVGNNEFVTSTAVIKAKKKWSNFRSNRWDEYNGRLNADLYFNADKISNDYTDRGKVNPCVYDWLIDNLTGMEGKAVVNFALEEYENNFIYGSAMYKGHNISWYVDNQWAGNTGIVSYGGGTRTLILPVFMDEVKSIYVNVPEGDVKSEFARVYIYTHPYYSAASKKGRRRTYFQGYDVPTKFKADDYSLIPPMPDDNRRTLWWEPDVVADEKGNASVEVYNNSTCTTICVSAEGITPDGRFVASE